MPQALETEPELDSTTTDLVRAYRLLACRRTVGMAPNPIQLSEIKAYVDMFGVPSVGLFMFEEIVRFVDNAELDYLTSTSKNSARTENGPPRGNS